MVTIDDFDEKMNYGGANGAGADAGDGGKFSQTTQESHELPENEESQGGLELPAREVTKISQVTPSVTWFLRSVGLSNYYIIRIYNLVGDACQALIEDNPYWLLDEFPHMGFDKVDLIAKTLGFDNENRYRVEAGILLIMRRYAADGNTFAYFQKMCEEAASSLQVSAELVEDVTEDMVFDGRLQLSDVDGERVVYFYGYYKAECGIAGKLAALENPQGGLKPIGGNIEALIAKAESEAGIKLSAEQKEAVRNALLSGVSIITGGPGTGKTTIIKALISIAEGSGFKVAVAAPTGRAAKRVMETSGHFACTVHRLLEFYYDEESKFMTFGRNAERPLNKQVVIIDEASMMDLLLTEALCEAVTPGTRLIFVGDADQLPSVGAGNVLADLIDSEYFFTSRLTYIYRQDEQSGIVLNAHRINSGENPSFRDDFRLVRASRHEDILQKIVGTARGLASTTGSEAGLGGVQVITPTKKGIIGSVNLNAHLQEAFNPAAPGKDELKFGKTIFRVGDRVMQNKNNYQIEYREAVAASGAGQPAGTPAGAAAGGRHASCGIPLGGSAAWDSARGQATGIGAWPRAGQAPLFKTPDGKPDGKGVFNGEIGIVAACDPEMKTVTVVYDDSRWVEYPYVALDELELAYAITVHKSQGSEFDTVIMPMSWFPPVLATRSLLYTAVTRGKNEVIIVGDPKYMNGMVDNNRSRDRNSGLMTRITGMYGIM